MVLNSKLIDPLVHGCHFGNFKWEPEKNCEKEDKGKSRSVCLFVFFSRRHFYSRKFLKSAYILAVLMLFTSWWFKFLPFPSLFYHYHYPFVFLAINTVSLTRALLLSIDLPRLEIVTTWLKILNLKMTFLRKRWRSAKWETGQKKIRKEMYTDVTVEAKGDGTVYAKAKVITEGRVY